jgi:hypothetical protein
MPHKTNTAQEYVWLRPAIAARMFGLSRSMIYRLISGPNPPVKSQCLKGPGRKHGIRLISFRSLDAYISNAAPAPKEYPSA